MPDNDKIVFTGDLSFISLPDIFQTFGGINSTGILRMTCKYASNPGQIYFVNGNPINATVGPLNGLDAIYDMFGWTEGKVEFYREDVGVKPVINNSRMEIVFEAMRLLDEGEIKKIGPASDETAKSCRDESLIIRRPIVDSITIVEQENFSEGRTVVREGGHGDWMWVILEGVVRISKKTPKGDITMARLGEGCFLGNLSAFTIHGRGRNATGTIEGKVKLGVLDFQTLSDEFGFLSKELKDLLLSLDGRLRKISERVVDIYLKKDNTNKLINNKTILLKEGSSNKETLVITEGEAYVVRRMKKGYLLLMILGKGDVFGYMPFLDIGHEPRNAAILASKDLKVDKLDLKNLQKEYNQLSGTMKGLIEGVALNISLTTLRASQLKIKYSTPDR
jgi:hypothetical protein|tara:strand:- start:26063 stop:27238 length:1176 start_codon:yes stop_codon:yes gene_type:complete